MTKSLEERFWAKVVKGEGEGEGEDECWAWTGGCLPAGYGQIWAMGEDGVSRMRYAHRVSWELHFGPIPPGDGYHGTCVCHTCDNRLCVNKDHLFLGSNADNVADRDAKERHVACPGEENGQAKLTEDQVLGIRTLYATGRYLQRTLAAMFGVSRQQIGYIVNHKNWTHLEDT